METYRVPRQRLHYDYIRRQYNTTLIVVSTSDLVSATHLGTAQHLSHGCGQMNVD